MRSAQIRRLRPQQETPMYRFDVYWMRTFHTYNNACIRSPVQWIGPYAVLQIVRTCTIKPSALPTRRGVRATVQAPGSFEFEKSTEGAVH